MKILKRLPLTILLLFIITGAVGYFYGLRPNNAQAFFANLSEQLFPVKDTSTVTPDTLTIIDKQSAPDKKANSNPVPKKETIEFQPLPINPFASIDKHAKSCPKSEEKNIESLATYLRQNTSTDLEKARSIYIWLTKNIRYDDVGFNSNMDGDNTAEGVLKSRKAVCEGFSNLFYALGKQMNLQIEKVTGYSKGYGYLVGQKFLDTDHAWNVIKINGQGRVFDATWGEGNGKNVNGRLVSRKEFDNYWFNVNPYEAIFSHMPQNKSSVYVKPEIDLKTFENLPYIEKNYFEIGFDGATTYRSAYDNRTLQFPKCYSVSTHIKIVTAPKYNSLELNKPYTFELNVPRGISVAVIDSKKTWAYFDMDKGNFKITYTPSVAGELSISVKHEKGGKSYHTILEYTVKTAKVNA